MPNPEDEHRAEELAAKALQLVDEGQTEVYFLKPCYNAQELILFC